MTARFERDTAVTQVGAGRYTAGIQPGWDIGGNANGGYLIAIVARAIAAEVGRPPLSVTAHYVAPGRSGPVEIEVEVVRSGRRTATAIARMRSVSGASDVIVVLATFAEQSPGGLRTVVTVPPSLPPYEDCVSSSPAPGADWDGLGDRLSSRIDPRMAGFRSEQRTGAAEMAGWFGFVESESDDDRIDVFGVLLATDAMSPVCFNLPGTTVGWAPTIDLTVHIRAVPAPGMLRCHFRSWAVQDGMFEEDGEIWDSTGVLVAQSRQLALLPR